VKNLRAKLDSKKVLPIVGVLALICAAFAVPSVSESFHEADPDEHPIDPIPFVPPTPAQLADLGYSGYTEPTRTKAAYVAPVLKPTVETSQDGDLGASLKFRWSQFESGDRILAKVKFSNHSLAAMHIPASGEPNTGLAVVVEDADGKEVRRIVEAGKEQQLPRRLIKLMPGFETENSVVLVAEDEKPLAPGTYNVYVEMRADPILQRLGLSVWKAPKGPVRSEPVPLVVTARAQ
jgi:hypothetical protein